MSKRGNGEGSITKRSDGRWQGSVVVGRGADGKLMRKYLYGKTRSEVATKVSEVVQSIKSGEYIRNSDNPTVSEWVDCWLITYKKNAIKSTTFDQYNNLMKAHVKPKLGNRKLVDLKVDHLQSLVNSMHEHGLSTRTIKLTMIILHGAFKQAIKSNLMVKNIVEGVVLPRKEEKEMQIPTSEEQKLLIEELQKDYVGRALVLACYTGLRRGELLALEWTDFDKDARTLSVSKSLSRVNTYDTIGRKTKLIVTTPKSAKSKRVVPLIDSAVKLLIEHKRLQEQYREMVGTMYMDQNLIFSSSIGTYIDPPNLNRKLAKVTKRLGLKNFGPHTFRHCFATRGLEAGISLKVMQEVLGHSSVTVTGDIYTHVLHEHKAKEMEKLSNIF